MARTSTTTKSNRAPAYRQRRGYPQAIVTLTDARTGKRRDYWLGEHGSRVSREAYHRLIAAWEACDHALPDVQDDPPAASRRGGGDAPAPMTVAEVVMKFWVYRKKTYIRDEPNSSGQKLAPTVRTVRTSCVPTRSRVNLRTMACDRCSALGKRRAVLLEGRTLGGQEPLRHRHGLFKFG